MKILTMQELNQLHSALKILQKETDEDFGGEAQRFDKSVVRR